MIQCLSRRVTTTALLSSRTARGSFRPLRLGPVNRVDSPLQNNDLSHLMEHAFRILSGFSGLSCLWCLSCLCLIPRKFVHLKCLRQWQRMVLVTQLLGVHSEPAMLPHASPSTALFAECFQMCWDYSWWIISRSYKPTIYYLECWKPLSSKSCTCSCCVSKSIVFRTASWFP